MNDLRNWLFFLIVNSCLAASAFTGRAAAQERKLDDVAGLTKYATVQLKADLSSLDENHQKMIPHLITAAKQMDSAFWYQAFGDPASIAISGDLPGKVARQLNRHVRINYGPWERLQEDRPFLSGFQAKPKGANFYPVDMTREEFESQVKDNPALKSLYTFVRWDESGGKRKLKAVPYSRQFRKEFSVAARQLKQAARLTDDAGLRAYLNARAAALLSDRYQESDFLWMDMKSNRIDCVIGPIETYEDKLYGYKAACECYVLVKDMSWSDRLSKYAALLPKLQQGLPVDPKYKTEKPGTKSDLNAYDVIYYAGDCNAGSKTIAINLPNDEQVQLEKGSRRLQLKNAMRAKFDKILLPISEVLIVPEQRQHVTFPAFFGNTMFHEVAHGLGIKQTITGKGTVREALRDNSSALEEGKADVLGVYMVTRLLESGDLTEGVLEDYYITFMAGIFRSVRFGASSAHGKANMIRFNFFKEQGAFSRNEKGQYRVNMDRMKVAIEELSKKLLMLQGEGDYEAAARFAEQMGFVGDVLKADLDRVNQQGIPTDIVFEQGVEVLGLKASGTGKRKKQSPSND
ncbi:MAG: Zn-dependent hydrolase [Planctomycetota bacterium]|nr:Zn-dependent hydrolase [Planctomycetota bacterium]